MIVVYRIVSCLLQMILVIDELGQVFIRSPIYIVTGYNIPSAHETISAWVGSSAFKGYAWAIEAAKLLDAIFGKGHCERARLFDLSVETPA